MGVVEAFVRALSMHWLVRVYAGVLVVVFPTGRTTAAPANGASHNQGRFHARSTVNANGALLVRILQLPMSRA
jgi:hypothetical protein